MIASDVVAVIVGYVVATVIQQLTLPVPDETLWEEVLFAVFVVPVWVLMLGANNLFLARAVSRFEEELRRLFAAGLMASGFVVAVLFVAQYDQLSRLWVALLFVCVTSSLVVSRLFGPSGVQQICGVRAGSVDR